MVRECSSSRKQQQPTLALALHCLWGLLHQQDGTVATALGLPSFLLQLLRAVAWCRPENKRYTHMHTEWSVSIGAL